MRWGNDSFAGEIPRSAARQLPPEAAQRAVNVWHDHMTLRPIRLRAAEGITFPSSTRTIYRFDATRWFAWDSDVDVVAAPVREDVLNRVMWTGDGQPKQTSSTIMQGGAFVSPGQPISRNLGVPAPLDTPGVAAGSLTDSATDAVAETHTWVFTWLTDLDEEGPPSPASDLVARGFNNDGTIQPVTVTTPTVLHGPTGVNRKRIYRSATSAEGVTTFRLVATVAIASPTYTDQTLTADLGATLITTTWDPPPADLRGLIALPNGVLGGFTGRDVWFSEPYQPHAWPVDYVQTMDFPVVGLDHFGTNVVVGTTGRPYLIAGNHPAEATSIRVELDQACVAKNSFAYLDRQGVVYASPDGLVLVGPQGGDLITRRYYTEATWQDERPQEFRAVYHDNAYLGFNTQEIVCIDPENKGVVRLSEAGVKAVFEDRERDQIYFVGFDSTLQRLDTSPTTTTAGRHTLTWQSREYTGPLRTYSAVQVVSDETGGVAFQLMYDGATTALGVPLNEPTRLPPLPLARNWSYQIQTTRHIQQIWIGTMSEMIGG